MPKGSSLTVVGRNEVLDLPVYKIHGVPAKIDTGADSSAIWASDISVSKDGTLQFVLFGEESEHYSGELVSRKDFRAAKVMSSNGQSEVRYRAQITVVVAGKRIKAMFNLSNRSKHTYPILIGRRTLAGKFLVDVRRGNKPKVTSETAVLNDEMKQDPYAFFKKYHQKDSVN